VGDPWGEALVPVGKITAVGLELGGVSATFLRGLRLNLSRVRFLEG
jgi:hypothetical protein